MRVFVTGGSGFLGKSIIDKLSSDGIDVRSFSRNKIDIFEEMGITHYLGDIRDYTAVKDAMDGCSVVIHSAAKIGIQGSYKEFYEINVKGTENVIRACNELKIRYLIFTSSSSVVFSGNSEGQNENLPYPNKFDAFYPKTKAIAEQLVLSANGVNMLTVVLRPHLIWGPGDTQFLPRLIERHRKGTLRLIGRRKYLVDVTYVDNAAIAHVQVLNTLLHFPEKVAGKVYFISQDDPILIQDFINGLLCCAGLEPVTKRINPFIARTIGHLIQGIFRTLKLKSEPPFDLFIAKQFSSSHWYDISAAKKDFNYKPQITTEEGMNRLKSWYSN
ncbi:NAD-dependent epimerase/dehydratase family protein [Aegicerativicinus sediminis]|uniref:NAD-dependent epimerase/dehydratase family protein n=1 Tax=Aegicerativicinus sediminis TaxID=2893202 RepID=UPI001E5D9E0E|nr:NAD-dependent epimerase/dehydratase family protein [Aegicerativicinus sediminis]